MACIFPLVLMGTQGCSSKNAESAGAPTVSNSPAAPSSNAGGPSTATMEQDKSQSEDKMKQAREAALAGWKQAHPGQKAPAGL